MLLKKIFPFLVIVVWSVFLSSALSARPQDVAEAARKAKAKKQQEQAESASTTPAAASKPKTFTNDDFPGSGGGGGAKEGEPVIGSTEKPEKGKDTAIVTLALPHSTIKHPGGTQVIWTFKNTSDHWLDITLRLVIDGPCGYHADHPFKFRINEHGGGGDGKTFNQAFYSDTCPGDYRFELRAETFGRVLSSASTTLKIQ
ncbi:MAG TPA: hypothetical protein VEU98_11820 [Candidatus Eremiobacteraceae bacterium]|nr:hypothetical protein [Candidatus Eremiobacteraceae bacterium]